MYGWRIGARTNWWDAISWGSIFHFGFFVQFIPITPITGGASCWKDIWCCQLGIFTRVSAEMGTAESAFTVSRRGTSQDDARFRHQDEHGRRLSYAHV